MFATSREALHSYWELQFYFPFVSGQVKRERSDHSEESQTM